MSGRTWVRLVAGLLGVLVVVAGLTVHLNDRRGRVTSVSASVDAATYDVGTSYTALVTEQLVTTGDRVRAGDPLFVLDSAALRHDVTIGLVAPAASESMVVAEDGTLTLVATADGVVVEVLGSAGSFVQSGTPLATVERAGSRYVTAEYHLSAPQLARLEAGAPVTVTLPDGSTLPGEVAEIGVTTTAAQAEVSVRVESPELAATGGDVLTARGTPVSAEVALRNDGVVTTVADRVEDWAAGTLGIGGSG